MQGYWKAAEATACMYKPGAYPADRQLHTGDYFRRDAEGHLYFLGRKDDMIKSGGERISAKEIENILCAMEGVAEAAAVGVPDSVLGQVVKAYVSPMPGVSLTPGDVLRFCKNNLENFLVPKSVEIVEQLPKTAHGKVDKKPLAAGRVYS
jgi:acyl-coenzyme A synthetase/AMP-(fatty) acid ligase